MHDENFVIFTLRHIILVWSNWRKSAIERVWK